MLLLCDDIKSDFSNASEKILRLRVIVRTKIEIEYAFHIPRQNFFHLFMFRKRNRGNHGFSRGSSFYQNAGAKKHPFSPCIQPDILTHSHNKFYPD
jgi:hypothetical protein